MKVEYLERFSKILKHQISRKSVQWDRSCSIRADGQTHKQADGQTDMIKLTVDFRSFAKARNGKISFPNRTHGKTFPIIPFSL